LATSDADLLAFRQNPLLIGSTTVCRNGRGQDVHEHGLPNEKGVFVNLAFRRSVTPGNSKASAAPLVKLRPGFSGVPTLGSGRKVLRGG
jgi:hypothetical protein